MLRWYHTVSYTHLDVYKRQDLGCGTGALLKEIKELNIAEQLFGIDISPNMLEIAKNKLGRYYDMHQVIAEALKCVKENLYG